MYFTIDYVVQLCRPAVIVLYYLVRFVVLNMYLYRVQSILRVAFKKLLLQDRD